MASIRYVFDQVRQFRSVAVRYRDDSRKVTVNIFHTGICVILGAKTVSIIHETVAILRLDKMLEVNANLKFMCPFGCIVSGPSMSGKSHFILRLIKRNDLFDPPPDRIV